MATLTFSGDERRAEVDGRESVLAAGLRVGVPLVHACGGQAKCTTCRVLVLEGLDHCPPRTASERVMADARRFPPEVRLACQTRPTADVTVRRLVHDEEDREMVLDEVRGDAPRSVGEERRLGILFCDVRDFTAFAEAQLPYDVIHVLNRHFKHAHAAIERHGGRVDNYMGDGVMALFGLDDPANGAIQAVRAGLDLVAEAAAFRPWFESQFPGRFRIGVGIHWGDVVLGTVGAGERRRLTAICDAVNLASRVEAANKEAGTSLLLTEEAFRAVEPRVRAGRRVTSAIRGKSGTYTLVEVVGLA